MWPFSKTPALSESQQWLVETFTWLVKNVYPDYWESTDLQIPSSENFSTNNLSGRALAEHLFTLVKTRSLMDNWDIVLKPAYEFSEDAGSSTHSHLAIKSNEAAGTFQLKASEDNKLFAEITYNPSLLSAPVDFMATMAHELAHYVIAGREHDIPGGPDYHEHATDMTAIYLGWGVFLLRSSSRYEQYSAGGMDGYGYTRQGYLSANQCAFTLGLFLEAKGIDSKSLDAVLTSEHFRLVKKNVHIIRQTNCLVGIRSIPLTK